MYVNSKIIFKKFKSTNRYFTMKNNRIVKNRLYNFLYNQIKSNVGRPFYP